LQHSFRDHLSFLGSVFHVPDPISAPSPCRAEFCPHAGSQHRRCGIFVETHLLIIPSSVGAASSEYAAPTELVDRMAWLTTNMPHLRCWARLSRVSFFAKRLECGAFAAALVWTNAFIHLLTTRAGESARGLAQSNTVRVFERFGKRTSVMDRGGKRSATPLSSGRRRSFICWHPVRAKAPSPLRSAGALQDDSRISEVISLYATLYVAENVNKG